MITQAQADALKQRDNAFPFAGRWNGWLSQNGVDYDALLADALGITPEKLQEARTQAFNARIDQAVTDGKLSQEQADLMKGRRALAADETFRALHAVRLRVGGEGSRQLGCHHPGAG